MATRMSRLRKVVYWVLLLVVGLGVLYFAGPKVPVDTTVTFDAKQIGDDVDAYIAAREAEFRDIKPGNAKQIVWAFPASRARTPLAIVYVHGFSASPGEIRPLPDLVASELGANLFLTRLAGHGRTGDAMLEGSVNAWMNDFAEAVAIGRRLGERVVIIATSTGATLSTLAALQPELMADVAGLVQISPNYGIKAAGSDILTLRWASTLVPLIAGETRGFEPRNDLHRMFWTISYPSLALLPMGALVKLAAGTDVTRATVPSLFIYSPTDGVIRADLAADFASRWGGAKEVVEVGTSGDPLNHVIAGDALSPETTANLAARTTAWIRGL